MKAEVKKAAKGVCLGALILGLVAWSPSTTDKVVDLAVGGTNATVASAPTVVLGNGNTLDGTATGTPVTGRGIVVGQNNVSGAATAASTRRFSIILGELNKAVSRNTIVAGYQNSLTPGGDDYTTAINHSAVFGISNTLETGGDSGLLVSGTSNTIYHANNSFAMGSGNTLGGSTLALKAYNSAAIGYVNQVTSTSGWALGSGNIVQAQNGVAIGVGNKCGTAMATVIGKYNAPTDSSDVVVIGTGTADTSRSTALRVTDDGGVILGRVQGDISMGIYGN